MSDSVRSSMLPLAIVVGAIVLGVLVVIPVVVIVSGGGTDRNGRDATPTVVDAHELTIEIRDFEFRPGNVTVPLGTTVTWLNRDEAPHDATDDGGDWKTDRLDGDDTDTIAFDTAGTYDYHCSIHPYMKARLTVRPD